MHSKYDLKCTIPNQRRLYAVLQRLRNICREMLPGQNEFRRVRCANHTTKFFATNARIRKRFLQTQFHVEQVPSSAWVRVFTNPIHEFEVIPLDVANTIDQFWLNTGAVMGHDPLLFDFITVELAAASPGRAFAVLRKTAAIFHQINYQHLMLGGYLSALPGRSLLRYRIYRQGEQEHRRIKHLDIAFRQSLLRILQFIFM